MLVTISIVILIAQQDNSEHFYPKSFVIQNF